jgi:hypothetical protein
MVSPEPAPGNGDFAPGPSATTAAAPTTGTGRNAGPRAGGLLEAAYGAEEAARIRARLRVSRRLDRERHLRALRQALERAGTEPSPSGPGQAGGLPRPAGCPRVKVKPYYHPPGSPASLATCTREERWDHEQAGVLLRWLELLVDLYPDARARLGWLGRDEVEEIARWAVAGDLPEALTEALPEALKALRKQKQKGGRRG